MAMEPADPKQALRAALLARRAAQHIWLASRRSRLIAGRVRALSVWRRARMLLAYAAIRGEADPAPLVRRALAEGRIVALPRIVRPPHGRGPGLAFHRIGPSTVLRPGRFGIPEPADDDATRVDPGGADLVLVPGVAFAPGGGRVGYGGGYYDALLRGFAPHEDGPVTVGIGFEFQVCPEVPREKWDAAVDAVVTECGVRLSGSRGRPHSFRSSTRVPPTKN